MKYNQLCHYFSDNEFCQFTPTEARTYFDSFVESVKDRIDNLQIYINETGGDSMLDYSDSSLKLLWKWFAPHICIVEKRAEEYEEESSRVRLPFTPSDVIQKWKFSDDTLAIALDIAAYFGETMVKNNTAVHWGFFTKPKNRVSVNQPVLLGFKHGMDLNPVMIVKTCMHHSLDRTDNDLLYETYNIWLRFI